MNTTQRITKIVSWIKEYTQTHKIDTLVVGVSGGIDSAVVSTLCVWTGIPTVAATLPIRQRQDLHDLSLRHSTWLSQHYYNVTHQNIDLTATFNSFNSLFPDGNTLALANSRARLRMMTLYQIAQTNNGIVVGTGNKVEDFGIGFFTKYGDGGVDISPIGDCMKSEVWNMGRELGVADDIINAKPTDGLWDDGRTDQDQLGGLTYDQLEIAMQQDLSATDPSNAEQHTALAMYRSIREKTIHKMLPIPVCLMRLT